MKVSEYDDNYHFPCRPLTSQPKLCFYWLSKKKAAALAEKVAK